MWLPTMNEVLGYVTCLRQFVPAGNGAGAAGGCATVPRKDNTRTRQRYVTVGESSGLASLDSAGRSDIAMNSETQALRASVEHPDLRFISPSRVPLSHRSSPLSGDY